MIATQSLGFRIDGKALLEPLETSIPEAAITAILGPNGAGKSTLLRLIAGGARPSSGRVEIAGKALGDWDPRALARVRAVVTQFNHIAFPFTVRQVVELGRAPHRGLETRARHVAAVDRAMEQVEVEALAARHYPALSGGEQQRVAIARALAQLDGDDDAPRCLLLDEPTASLDLLHQLRLLQLLRELADRGHTVVVVLHDLNLALSSTDHAVMLKQGRCLAAGATATVLEPELIDTAFGVRARHELDDQGNARLAFSV